MNTLKYGDTIGIISPSWVADKDAYGRYVKWLERLGFQARLGKNIYKDPMQYGKFPLASCAFLCYTRFCLI